MQRVQQNQFNVREPIRSTFEAGLRELFAACHEPLPARMEELLRRLQNHHDDQTT